MVKQIVMEAETLVCSISSRMNSEFHNNPALPYDLPELIKKMKNSADWKNGELVAAILLNSPEKQIVLTVLQADTEIQSFQSGDSTTFQIIEGKLKFHSREETYFLEIGQHITLYNNIRFSLTTHDQESAFLLTINTGSSASGN